MSQQYIPSSSHYVPHHQSSAPHLTTTVHNDMTNNFKDCPTTPWYKYFPFIIVYYIFICFKFFLFIFKFLFSYFSEIKRQRKQRKDLIYLLENKVQNFEEYKQLSLELDQIEGYDLWKTENECNLYDYEQIEHLNYQLMALLRKKDIHGLLWIVRSHLHRNIAGIGNERLYECHIESKQLIEEYIDLVCKALLIIRDSNELSLEEKLKFFRDTSHAYGRTGLLLSGGGGLALYHLGVVKALYLNGLLPKVISGSSGGAIVASLIASRKEEDIGKCFEPNGFKLEAFGAPDDSREKSAIRKINRLLNNGVIMDVQKLAHCIRENIGDLTFEEAYKLSGRVLNITVNSVGGFQTHEGLLNYLTAPNVLIWSAACASSSLPGLYKAVPLMAKDSFGNVIPFHPSPSKFQDGTLLMDLPITRLAELFNVNFYIASQVNPHVLPFISNSKKKKSLLASMMFLFFSEIKYRIQQLYYYGLIPERFAWFEQILSQPYSADVTIVPCDLGFDNLSKILTNPTAEYIKSATAQSLRRTFPHMNRIENMLKIELALDSCLRHIRSQLFQSNPPTAIQLSKSSSLFDLEEDDMVEENQ
ncbi:hypothetical protein ABK040_006642 [Willaertia magna]